MVHILQNLMNNNDLNTILNEHPMSIKNNNKQLNQQTLCIHAEKNKGALITALYQMFTFLFNSVGQGYVRFSGEEEGYIYTLLGNSTTREFELKMADATTGKA